MNDGMTRQAFYPCSTGMVAYLAHLGAQNPERHVMVRPVVGYTPCQHTGELMAAVMEPSSGVVFPVAGTDYLENEMELVTIRPVSERVNADEIVEAGRSWKARQAAYRARAS